MDNEIIERVLDEARNLKGVATWSTYNVLVYIFKGLGLGPDDYQNATERLAGALGL